MLNDCLLTNFMNCFFGYGNLNADYWFIGMEEAGGKSEREILQRITRWKELGSNIVVDNFDFHRAVDDPEGRSWAYLFEGRPPLQSTWRGLIRIYLSVIGRPARSTEDVRTLQALEWGRFNSNNCLLELFPLPSPGTHQWQYNRWSAIDFLSNRETYLDTLAPSRVSDLRAMLFQHRPKCVVFYSMSWQYIMRWSEIAGTNLIEGEKVQLETSSRGQPYVAIFQEHDGILFTIAYHSTYKGLTNSYFEGLGVELRRRSA